MSDTPPITHVDPQDLPHNHQRKLLALIASGAVRVGAGLHHLTIAHDDWCGVFTGKYCNCDPTITLDWTLPDASKN